MTTSLTELLYGDKWELEVLLRYRMLKARLEKETDEYMKPLLEEDLTILKNMLDDFPENIDKEIEKRILAI